MGNSYNEYLNRVSHPTPTEDDGSLSFLGISTDRGRKSFSCEAKRQSDLVGESFWIVDYFPNIVVNGNEKYLYKAKWNLEDDDSLAFKVWTGSQECWAVLDKIAELGKAVGSYQGWLNYGNTRNLIHKLNTIGNGKVFK